MAGAEATMTEPEPWDVCNESGGGCWMFTGICIAGAVTMVCVVGHIILFAVGALP